jgi:hypothetical protein
MYVRPCLRCQASIGKRQRFQFCPLSDTATAEPSLGSAVTVFVKLQLLSWLTLCSRFIGRGIMNQEWNDETNYKVCVLGPLNRSQSQHVSLSSKLLTSCFNADSRQVDSKMVTNHIPVSPLTRNITCFMMVSSTIPQSDQLRITSFV